MATFSILDNWMMFLLLHYCPNKNKTFQMKCLFQIRSQCLLNSKKLKHNWVFHRIYLTGTIIFNWTSRLYRFSYLLKCLTTYNPLFVLHYKVNWSVRDIGTTIHLSGTEKCWLSYYAVKSSCALTVSFQHFYNFYYKSTCKPFQQLVSCGLVNSVLSDS